MYRAVYKYLFHQQNYTYSYILEWKKNALFSYEILRRARRRSDKIILNLLMDHRSRKKY